MRKILFTMVIVGISTGCGDGGPAPAGSPIKDTQPDTQSLDDQSLTLYDPTAPRMGATGREMTRSEATQLYQSLYAPSTIPAPMNFTGDVNGCFPGMTDQAYRSGILQRINYYRGLARLMPVAEDSTLDQYAQAAALLMAANRTLNHYPTSDWTCYNPLGADGAGGSNLSAGAIGVSAIDGYMNDGGSNNAEVGHRRWILLPEQLTMGVGDVPADPAQSRAGYSALYVFGPTGARLPTDLKGVAWPPAGEVPYHTLPSSKRWSFSQLAADFSRAAVTVQNKDGDLLPTTIVGGADWYGDAAIVFTVDNVAMTSDRYAWQPDVYTVTVTGAQGPNIPNVQSYTVRPFDLTPETWEDCDAVQITGAMFRTFNTIYARSGVSDNALTYAATSSGQTVSLFRQASGNTRRWVIALGPVGANTWLSNNNQSLFAPSTWVQYNPATHGTDPAPNLKATCLLSRPFFAGRTSNLTATPTTVRIPPSIANAVVIMGPATSLDPTPGSVRLANITPNSFDAWFGEWNYVRDRKHGNEVVSFAVFNQGRTLVGGKVVEAGRTIANGVVTPNGANWFYQPFSQPMPTVPIVIASVSTPPGVTPIESVDNVTVRVRNVTQFGFYISLQEQEKSDLIHRDEMIHWVAAEEGINAMGIQTSRIALTHLPSPLTPPSNKSAVFATMNTINEFDPAVPRLTVGPRDGLQLFLEEDQSRDVEVQHASETVGVMTLEP